MADVDPFNFLVVLFYVATLRHAIYVEFLLFFSLLH